MNFCDRLKSERVRLGYSQTDFAAIANASKHAQINWEKGVSSPNAVALTAWEEVGLDVLYVITGVDAETRKARADNQQGIALARSELYRQITARPPEPEVSEEESLAQRAALHAAGGFQPVSLPASGPSEDRLLTCYRRCSPADQALGLELLALLAARQDKSGQVADGHTLPQ